ncbi:MAG: hypothetical protein AAFM92_13835 [Pseudomonadota bacterium]
MNNEDILKDRVSLILLLIVGLLYFSIGQSYYLEVYYRSLWNSFSGLDLLLIYGLPAIWVLGSIAFSYSALRRIENAAGSGKFNFRRMDAFNYLGIARGTFEHAFSHDSDISSRLVDAIGNAMQAKGLGSNTNTLVITDRDRNLRVNDPRAFNLISVSSTTRVSEPSLIIRTQQIGDMHSVRWWLFEKGPITKNRKLVFLAVAPVAVFLWPIYWLRNKSFPARFLFTPYRSDYQEMDVYTRLRWAHETVFDTVADELDAAGIDTSTLREQKAQIMNINISGGKVSMGSVVQGAMNRVRGQASGAA